MDLNVVTNAVLILMGLYTLSAIIAVAAVGFMIKGLISWTVNVKKKKTFKTDRQRIIQRPVNPDLFPTHETR